MAPPSKGPFSFDQADSTRFAVSASASEAVATTAAAVIIFISKADWNWLAVAEFLSFQVRMRGWNLHVFTQGWEVKSHYHVVLFGAFLIRDDFHIADCTAETLAVEYVVYLGWVATRLYVIRSVSLFLNRVLRTWRPLATTNFRILSPSGLQVRKPCPPWTSLNTQAGAPTPFQSPTGISISVAMVLMEWLPCLASNLSLRRRGNLAFLLGHQPLVSSQRYDAVRHQSFELELSYP